METIAGYSTTGRRLKGPAADLVELTGDRGEKLSAIVFHPEYRHHRGINAALDVVVRFLEDPMVPDLLELRARDAEQGAFVYPTGQTWAVADVIRILADLGESAGIRAGLELLHKTGTILKEAAEYGADSNVYSHGGLTPWRVMLRQDGRVLVIGHALPQVEILMFHEDHTHVPPSDSFRYCPPERIHGEEEDLSSDLFSLCLIGFEFMTGKPVYDGLVNDIRQKAARGEGGRVLYQARDSLPASVRDILGNAMRLERADRHISGDAFLDAVARALNSGDALGPSLADVMRKASSQMTRRGVVPDSASTVMGTPAELRAMLDDEEDEPAAQPKREAWSPPSRASSRVASVSRSASRPAPEPVEAPAAVEDNGQRWSAALRRSGVRRAVRRDGAAPPESEALSAPISPVFEPTTAEPETPRWAPPGGRAPPRRVQRGAVAEAPDPAPSPAPEGPVDIQQVLRSSRVRRPVRQRLQEEAEAPISPPVEALSSGPAPGEALPVPEEPARPSTADLLARIRQSATRSRSSSVDTGPSPASALIDKLVRSSGRRSGVSPSPASAAPAEPPAPTSRVRPVRRGEGRAAVPDTETLPGPTPTSDATPVTASASPIVDSQAPAIAVAPAVSTPTQQAPAPDRSPREPATPAVSVPTVPDVAAQVEGALSFSASSTLARDPDAIPSDAGAGGSASFVIRRGEGGRTTRMRLPRSVTVAEAVAWMVQNLVPLRTDLTGRVTGWYRLQQSGALLPASTRMSDVDAEKPLVLVTVPNAVVMADISILAGAVPARFVAPVGTAVPVVSLLDHLCAWLSLPPGDYQLLSGGTVLAPHAILADLHPSDAWVQLQLSQVASGGEGR